MQTIDVRFQASSNFGAVQSQLAALTKQASALQAAFAANSFAKTPAAIDPYAWTASSKAVSAASGTFRDALAQSQLFTTQQIVARKESERFTEQLKKQNLTFKEMRNNKGIMAEVWRDQARFQRMTAQYWGQDTRGRAVTDIAVPTNVPTDLKNVNMQLAQQGYELQSGGKQWVNWGKNVQWAGRQLTVGFSYPMALIAGGAGLMAFKVDEAFTKIAKVYDYEADAAMTGASAVEQSNRLREMSMNTAAEAASKYGKSVSDTLDVMQNFAASGFSGQQLDDITQMTQKISVLGDLTKETSFPLIQSLWSAFGGAGKQLEDMDDLSSILDYLNKTANDTNLQLEDMAESIPRAATAMGGMGVTVEQMTTMLVAMREVGIDAAEGANALKSGTAAIINPTAAIVDSVKNLSGGMIDLKAMAKDTGGNMYEFMVQLHEAFSQIKGEGSDLAKSQILERIFGRYQFNRASAILENMGAALDGTENQTAKAMANMGLSVEELANSTEKSMSKIEESSAMKLRKAFEAVRIELAEMGDSLLPVATTFMQVVEVIFKAINALPGPLKIALGAIAAVTALAGPVGMLVGLIGNMAGTFASLAGKAMAWASGHKMVTKEEQAATLAAQAQNDAMASQGKAAGTLGRELSFLKEAYRLAAEQAKMFLAYVSGGSPQMATAGKQIQQQTQAVQNLATAYVQQSQKVAQAQRSQAQAVQNAQTQQQGAVKKTTQSFNTLIQTAQAANAAWKGSANAAVANATRQATPISNPNPNANTAMGQAMMQAANQTANRDADKAARNAARAAEKAAKANKLAATEARSRSLAEREIARSISLATQQANAHAAAQQRIANAIGQSGMRAQQQYAALQNVTVTTDKAADNQGKMNGLLQAGGVYGGIFSAAMVATMVSSNEMVQSFANMAMIGATLAPMAQGIASFMKEAATNRAASAAAAAAETTAVTATEAAQVKLSAMKAEQAAIERAIFTASVQRIQAVNAEGAGTARVVALEAEILALKNAQTVATGKVAAAEAGLTVAKSEQAAASAAAAASTNALMGPIGWTVLAVTAAVGAFMAWKKHTDAVAKKQEEMLKKQLEAQKALNDTASKFGEHIGKAVTEYKNLMGVQLPEKKAQMDSREEAFRYYTDEDEGKKVAKGLEDLNMSDLRAQLATVFLDLQRINGMTTAQAQAHLEGMLQAVGKGGVQAQAIAEQVADEWGNLGEGQWLKGVQVQVEALNKSMSDTFAPVKAITEQETGVVLAFKMEDNSANVKIVKQQAGQLAKVFEDALANETDPQRAAEIVQTFMNSAMVEWDRGLKNIMSADSLSSGDVQSVFREFGVSSGTEFADAWRNNKEFKKAITEMMSDTSIDSGMRAMLKEATAGGSEYEKTVVNALAKEMGILSDEIYTVADAQAALAEQGIGQTLSDAKAAAQDLNKEFMFGRISTQEFSDQIRLIAKAQGIKEGSTAMETFNNILNGVKDKSRGAEGEVKKLGNTINALKSKNISINIQADQMGGIYQDAMNGVKDMMVDQMTSNFQAQQDAENRALQERQEAQSRALGDRQEAAMDSLEARQEGAMERLENRQEKAEKRFEANLEKRKKAVENYYKSRIEAIDKAVKAEEAAQKRLDDLFEAEKKRLQDQADAEIRNIDYRKAVASGDMDEAARIAANAGAQDITSQLDDQQAAAKTASEKRIAALEKKRDILEKKSEKAMDRLEKKMDAMRDKFQKNQEAARDALAKRHEMERRGMERQQQAEQRAMQARQQQEQRAKAQRQAWARQEFDMKIALFRALPAANQRQLEKALKQSGLTLSDFGRDKVGPISNRWGKYFRDAMTSHLRRAGAQVASDNMWKEIGKKGGDAIVQGLGLGLGNMKDFQNWVKTGKIQNTNKKSGAASSASAGGDSQRRKIERQLGDRIRHGGGPVGDTGKNWRGGIAANMPLHPSEQMITAQKGEFLVNRKAASKHRNLLESINRGREGMGAGIGPFALSAGVGPMATIGGGILKATMNGMTRGIQERMDMEVATKTAQEAAALGSGMAGPGPIMSGPSGPVTALGRSAIGWARARMGYSGSTWINRCLSFVRQALGAPGIGYGAIDAWNNAKYKMHSTPPPGTPVFWAGGRYGHAALSTGGGRIISTDWPGAGTVSETTISALTSAWGKRYMGWTRDINGKLVYPALKTGGEVRYDNTLANLHRGETVLTAPLTKQFKDNVANMGNGSGDQINIDLRGAVVKEDVDIEAAVFKAMQKVESNRGRRRVVGG